MGKNALILVFALAACVSEEHREIVITFGDGDCTYNDPTRSVEIFLVGRPGDPCVLAHASGEPRGGKQQLLSRAELGEVFALAVMVERSELDAGADHARMDATQRDGPLVDSSPDVLSSDSAAPDFHTPKEASIVDLRLFDTLYALDVSLRPCVYCYSVARLDLKERIHTLELFRAERCHISPAALDEVGLPFSAIDPWGLPDCP